MEILRERLYLERRGYSERRRQQEGGSYNPYRKRRLISLSAASELMGLPSRALQQYETGQRQPSAESLAKIARFYGCSVDYLLGLTDNRERR